jgi:hypothetical protein
MPEYKTVTRREAFYASVLEGVRAVPGVTSAAFVSFLPISSFRGGIWPVSVKGDAEAATDVRTANNSAAIRYVTPGFFRAMSTPLKRGRDIDSGDTRDRPFVAVVSESFVRRYFPDQDPIGRHFTFAYADREIVGVAGDVRFRGLERKSEPQVYLSSQQVADGAITFYAPKALAVRTKGDPARFAPAGARNHPQSGSEAADYRSAGSLGHDRPGNVVAHGAGARARWLRDDRRSFWRRSASTVCCRSRFRSAPRKSAFDSRSARSPPTSSRWS